MGILQSVRNGLVPIHREGYRFIAIFFVIAVVLGLLWGPFFWLGLILTAWCAYFFRDPERATPVDPRLVVSPADGKISWVGAFVPPAELGLGTDEMMRISIFMNVFSVHINRMPSDGKIEKIVYRPGKFANAELDKSSDQNERNSLVVKTAHGRIGVVQVAGFVARRILCWPKKNDQLLAGERFGLIRFGSRLDVYLPVEAKLSVGVGQTAVAGETVLASFDQTVSIEDFRLD